LQVLTWAVLLCVHLCHDVLPVPPRYTREADAAAAAEEERRQAALKASKGLLAASLGQQVKERETLKHAHDDEEQVCMRGRACGLDSLLSCLNRTP
jgi:hypothetical protein